MRSRRNPIRGSAVAVSLVAAVVWLPPSPLLAGSTDPTLAVGQVRAQPAGAGALVEVTGTFGFDDVVQVNFPLSLVLYHGSDFVRYPVGLQAQSGVYAGLTDGFEVSEVAALEAAGATEAGAEVLRLEPARFVVALPAALAGGGTITAQLYVVVPGEGTFVSNAVTVALVAGGGA